MEQGKPQAQVGEERYTTTIEIINAKLVKEDYDLLINFLDRMNFNYTVNDEVAPASIPTEVQKEEWISVKDRLPSKGDGNKNGYVMSYHRSDRQWGWPTKYGFSKWDRVTGRTHTHWQPLPAPPNETSSAPSISHKEDEKLK